MGNLFPAAIGRRKFNSWTQLHFSDLAAKDCCRGQERCNLISEHPHSGLHGPSVSGIWRAKRRLKYKREVLARGLKGLLDADRACGSLRVLD